MSIRWRVSSRIARPTIQIRLTKEEHDTIAAQAGREGLGVGTYLRALALRNALESSGSPPGRALAALRRVQERAKSRGLDRFSPKAKVEGPVILAGGPLTN